MLENEFNNYYWGPPAGDLIQIKLTILWTTNLLLETCKTTWGIEFVSIECRRTKTKLWPITQDTDNPLNQSKLQANTHLADAKRGKTCTSDRFWFDFLFDDKEKRVFKPIV